MSNLSVKVFFDEARRGALLGPELTQEEVSGCMTILDAMSGTPLSFVAYALATAYHETAHTMQPVHEYGGPKYFTRLYDIQGANQSLARRLGNLQPGDGAKYAGRGYVQLTGRYNYRKAGTLLSINLVDNPGLAMRHDIAAKVMRLGMVGGWFTGKALVDYLPSKSKANKLQFTQARRIINGTDKAARIADYALQFQEYLSIAGWPND